MAFRRKILWHFTTDAGHWVPNDLGTAAVVTLDWAEDAGKFGGGLTATGTGAPADRWRLYQNKDLKTDAKWRSRNLPMFSLWMHGDGTPATAMLYLHCVVPDPTDSYTLDYIGLLPLDEERWRRFPFEMRLLSHGKDSRTGKQHVVPFNLAHLARVEIRTSGDHEIRLDEIALENAHTAWPFERIDLNGGVTAEPSLWAIDGGWLLRFSPNGVTGVGLATARVTWPGGATTEHEVVLDDSTHREGLLVVEADAVDPGEATLQFTLVDGAGAIRLDATYRFPARFDGDALEPVGELLPTPKTFRQLRALTKAWPVRNRFEIGGEGPEAEVEPIVTHLAEDIDTRLGVTVDQLSINASGTHALTLGDATSSLAAARLTLQKLASTVDGAYVLESDNKGASVVARERSGLLHGAQTLFQLLSEARGSARRLRAHETLLQATRISDWPDLEMRAVLVILPANKSGSPVDATVDVAFFTDYLLDSCMAHKLNTVIVDIRRGMKSAAENGPVGTPGAWSQKQITALVKTLRARGVNVIPMVNSFGHAHWFLAESSHLRQSGWEATLCALHPLTWHRLEAWYKEVITVFAPTHFHMGMDEVWKNPVDPIDGSNYSDTTDKTALFLMQVTKIRDFLVENEIRPMMHGDMLVPAHRGGPPHGVAATIDDIPKDIIITDWSRPYDPLSSYNFHKKGFRVVGMNSRGIPHKDAAYVQGNCFSQWFNHGWLTEGASGDHSHYSYLPTLQAAEYSWNLYPRVMEAAPPADEKFFPSRMAALTRIAYAGHKLRLESLRPSELRRRAAVDTGRLRLRLWKTPVVMGPALQDEWPVGMPAESVCILATADVAPNDRDGLREEHKEVDAWRGVPIAVLTMHFEDGSEESWEIGHGFDVRDQRDSPLPFTYGAIGYYTNKAGRLWYVLRWVNPRPSVPIEKIVLADNGKHAHLLVLAAAIEPPEGAP
ncbi:MAG: hypothetical protein ACI9K2_005820 [Myxococcota bacterium]|jgi:hypothetical protein